LGRGFLLETPFSNKGEKEMVKQYKVIGSFSYRGPDGKKEKAIVIGPGEDVPKLDSNERERLLRLGKIAEVSQETGEIILHQTPEDLKDDQIDGLMKKHPRFIISFLTARQSSRFPLSKEVLSKIYSIAEAKKMPAELITRLEQFIAA